MRTKMKMLLGVVALLALVLAPAQAHAAAYTLTHNNSTAVIDPSSQMGMYTWSVDGVDQLYQQWFWFRIGTGDHAYSINTLSLTSVDASARTLDVLYTGNGFTIDVFYRLTGGQPGSGTSDTAEVIAINNIGSQSLNFHFFQYSDFDLNGQIGGQSAQFIPPVKMTQTGGGYEVSETTVVPNPGRWEAGIFASTLNNLNNTVDYVLNNVSFAGPGDATWAFEWDFTLGPRDSFLISKNKLITAIPEPGSMVLLGSGLLGLAAAVRRRLRK